MRFHCSMLAVLPILLFTLACAPATEQPPPAVEEPAATMPSEAADRAAIEATMDALEAAYANGDIDEMLATYTDDVVYMPANQPASRGQAEFRAASEPFNASNLKMTTDEAMVHGD